MQFRDFFSYSVKGKFNISWEVEAKGLDWSYLICCHLEELSYNNSVSPTAFRPCFSSAEYLDFLALYCLVLHLWLWKLAMAGLSGPNIHLEITDSLL